jgi:hypothetical protein
MFQGNKQEVRVHLQLDLLACHAGQEVKHGAASTGVLVSAAALLRAETMRSKK